MVRFEVVFYETKDGKSPVEDFLASQNPKMKARLVALFEMLEDYGNQLREPYSKPIGDGIFEIRCISGNNIARVLYFFCSGRRIVLTNGFIKKTQKTPLNEIRTARKRRKEFMERMSRS